MTGEKQLTGRWGEAQAAIYLEQRGYSILERNVRTPYGEIDLVAQIDENPHWHEPHCLTTVFVEVKTRSSSAFGLPEEAVTRKKKEHLQAACQAYIEAHPEHNGAWRVDVIAIRRLQDGSVDIAHFENVLT